MHQFPLQEPSPGGKMSEAIAGANHAVGRLQQRSFKHARQLAHIAGPAARGPGRHAVVDTAGRCDRAEPGRAGRYPHGAGTNREMAKRIAVSRRARSGIRTPWLAICRSGVFEQAAPARPGGRSCRAFNAPISSPWPGGRAGRTDRDTPNLPP